MNIYVIAAAVIVGATSGAASVRWIRLGVHTTRVLAGGAGVGLAGTLAMTALALPVFGPDQYMVVHVAYLVLVVGVPLAGAVVLGFARPRPRAITGLCLASFAVIPVGVYATHIEPFWLRVDSVQLSVGGIGETVRIGVMADLQATEIGSYENEALDRLIALEPDMVVFPGDLHQLGSSALDERAPQFTEMIRRLVDAVPVVYLVNGHSDTPSELRWITQGTGAKVLDNEIDTFELNGNVIHIAGISLLDDEYESAAWRAAEQLAGDNLPGLRIVLAHEPDAVKLVERTPVDLLVSGHTHGGQVSIPFFGPPITASSVPRHVAAGGLHELHGTPVYVSTGVGRERGNAPQLRFGVRPSIGIIDLVGEEWREAGTG